MSSNTKVYEDKMKNSVEHLERELAAVRAGRANPAVLDKVLVEYYGAPTPIQQVASVAVSEARTLTITPWDRSLLRPISKAIQASDVGINPIDDGQTIRLNFPAPNEERRRQLAKEVSKMGEDAKVAVRNVRREAMDKAKAMKKAGELTEDDQKSMEEAVQKITDKYVKLVDKAVEEKQKEIMSV
ncbi:MAG TPA: ribosome recycling factor [Candidatus Faecalibacterium faecipullorum]|uniref:Ribosome-recycling factor n=1 Tax=Candidatus Faecalibacterium faecipullorum TaxID=2838578 RepID=A0A9D2S6Q3_9FIRM|nr:ribosome recycling factor [Candidatus Faecalibacterium faecipullorum]